MERRPVSEAERRRILDDPLVRKLQDDFEGVIVNLEQIIPRQQADADAEPQEDTDELDS